MNLSRILYLRGESSADVLSYGEIQEIQSEFDKIPDSELRDERENATASDMLDELRDRVSETEKVIYNFVLGNYGESEADDPSWDISALAEAIDDFNKGVKDEVGKNN